MRNLGFLSLATALAMGAVPTNANTFGNPGSDTSGWTLVTGVGCQDAHWVQGGIPAGSGLTACPGPGSPPTTTQTGSGVTGGTTRIGGEDIPPAGASGSGTAGGSGSDSAGGSGSDITGESGSDSFSGGLYTIVDSGGNPPGQDPGPGQPPDGQPGGQHPVPEPATLGLFGAGLAALGAMRRRKAKS